MDWPRPSWLPPKRVFGFAHRIVPPEDTTSRVPVSVRTRSAPEFPLVLLAHKGLLDAL